MTGPEWSAPTADELQQEPAGEDLRAQLARYQAMVEFAPDAIVILDVTEGRFVSVNAAAEQLFGMTRDDLLRSGPVEVSPPVQPDGRPSATAAMAYVRRALGGERPRFTWLHRRADGTDVPCEITLLRLPDPDRELVRGSILDITGRQEAEAARAAAIAEQSARQAAEVHLARLRATLAGLNAIVWERDPVTMRLTFVNERADELLGYPAARWMADERLWLRILHPDDREQTLARVREEIAGDGVDFSLTYRVRAVDGRWVWLQHLGHIARDDDGTPADPACGALRRDRGPTAGAVRRAAGCGRPGADRARRRGAAAARARRAAGRRAGRLGGGVAARRRRALPAGRRRTRCRGRPGARGRTAAGPAAVRRPGRCRWGFHRARRDRAAAARGRRRRRPVLRAGRRWAAGAGWSRR